MASSLSPTVPATPRESLADLRPRQAKADLRAQEGATASTDPQSFASPLRDLAAETLRRVTSQKAAAIDIGIHEGRLSHKLKDGSLTVAQLEALGPVYAAELGELLVAQYGPLSDPKDAARKALERIEDELRLLRQYVEDVA
jgi:hypothetical protein